MSDPGTLSKADAAVQRSLQRRQSAAEAEVGRLIEAGRTLFGDGGNPRVADIVRVAGVSLEAFYRYFGSKQEFVAAVAEDGGRRVTSYVEHKMSAEADPHRRLRAAVEALMSQASRPELAAAARNILNLAGAGRDGAPVQASLADLLAPTLKDLGSSDPSSDASVAAVALVGILQDHVWRETKPSRREVDHLVGFIAAAVTSSR
ncbi:TetR/AcrR family transcriptional regulator [Nocardioides sp. Iso805N]|uniref:TetR/AcrR family transcriptional regulator n=1 Tax=Nocardioides sp. Iso805N TaxID=1283287 RepID=UPI0003736B34|nr:TetR/AcrR family transcriptional regulator [Nocardioides sp. Iso805N]